jgi:hypothetical protein
MQPDTYTVSPTLTPCEYGPTAAGALSVLITSLRRRPPRKKSQAGPTARLLGCTTRCPEGRWRVVTRGWSLQPSTSILHAPRDCRDAALPLESPRRHLSGAQMRECVPRNGMHLHHAGGGQRATRLRLA